MTSGYYWRNVNQRPCAACGRVHELLTKDCEPIVFDEPVIRYEKRLAPDEFLDARQAEADERSGARSRAS